MCESTDFIKEDGLFVCQCCGIKYSLAEAKNLMSEDTDKIKKDESLFYKSTPGLLFELKDDDTYEVTGYEGKDNKVYIPKKYNGRLVTSIGGYAFHNCGFITSIEIPNSVISIGEEAFSNCTSLTSITIPDSVTSIIDDAFLFCCSLIEVINKSSLNIAAGSDDYGYVGSYAEYIITHESQSVLKTVGQYIFYDSGTEIYLVKYVGSDTEITLPEYDGGKEYGVWQYAFCDNDTIISVLIPDSVTSIGDGAFRDCSSLKSIEIPDAVTSIGDYVFCGCKSLTNIEMPDSITSIGEEAFHACESLTSIEIPDSVTSIGGDGFSGCTSLTSVEIPDSVISIGDGAFYHCKSLKSVKIGNSVTSIGYAAFGGCESLTSINIPDSVTSIAEETFSDCTSLTSIDILDSVTSIGDFAFNGCTSLRCIVMGDSVTSVGDAAFRDCTALEYIYIPTLVSILGNDAFKGCSSLTIYCQDSKRSQAWNKECNPLNRPIISGCKFGSTPNEMLYNMGEAHILQNTLFHYEEAIKLFESVRDFKDSVHRIEECKNDIKKLELMAEEKKQRIEYEKENLWKYYEFKFISNRSTYQITKCKDKSIRYAEIPCEYNGYPIGSIDVDAFLDCDELVNVSISKFLDNDISLDGLLNCFNLESIVVDENNNRFRSIDGVLYSKDGTCLMVYPRGKKNESFVIPHFVTNIENWSIISKYLKKIIIKVIRTCLQKACLSETGFYNRKSLVFRNL